MLQVNRYLDVELDPQSPTVAGLYTRIDLEAAGRPISLTGDGDAGSICGNLTPAMNAWLSDHVVRPRQAALGAVEGVAASIRLSGNVPGIVEEIEEDRIRRERNQRRTQEVTQFHEHHHDRLAKLAEVEREYRALRAEEGGRDAKTPSKLLDYGVPAMIALPEFFMNYASFLKLSGVVAIGAGLSVIVAMAIAVSAYMTGTFFKAYHFYMHPDDPEQRQKGQRLIGIASTLLAIALSAVAYARYHMVLEQAEAAMILGLSPPNVAAQTGGLLAGNLLVFAIGAALTYLMHDENPAFAEKAAAYRLQRAEVDRIKAKELTAKLTGIEQNFNNKLKKLRAKASQMGQQPDYLAVADHMSAIDGKDAQVIGVLTNYRMQLADRLHAINPDYRFRGPQTDRLAANSEDAVTLAEFTALPLSLYRSS